jgi:hypothetical protein
VTPLVGSFPLPLVLLFHLRPADGTSLALAFRRVHRGVGRLGATPTGLRQLRHQMLGHLVHRATRQHTLKSCSGWQTWDNALDRGFGCRNPQAGAQQVLVLDDAGQCLEYVRLWQPDQLQQPVLVGREIDDKQQREVVFRPKLRPGSLSFGSNALLPPRQNPSLTLP